MLKNKVKKHVWGGVTYRKGFTLIELLAVIVILAIIALIATPIVLDIIDDSKESSKDRGEQLYLDSINQAVARYQLNNKTVKDGIYYILENGDLCLESQEEKCDTQEINVDVNGEVPGQGYVGIVDNQIVSYDFREKENADGYSVVKAEIERTTKEETGETYIILKIIAEENIGMMSHTINVIYNSKKLKYKCFYIGYLFDYLVYEISEKEIGLYNLEKENKEKTEIMVRFAFTSDDLDSVDASDFAVYITASNYDGQNVIINQSTESEIKIINGNLSKSYQKIYTSSDYISGDINGDRYIDHLDLVLLRKSLLDSTITKCRAMDVNGNGSIDIADLVRLKKYLAGMSSLENSPLTDLPNHL